MNMTWTKQTPTKAGWYFWRLDTWGAGLFECVHFDPAFNQFMRAGDSGWWPSGISNQNWLGPIRPEDFSGGVAQSDDRPAEPIPKPSTREEGDPTCPSDISNSSQEEAGLKYPAPSNSAPKVQPSGAGEKPCMVIDSLRAELGTLNKSILSAYSELAQGRTVQAWKILCAALKQEDK
jgi:hypothetical protein